MGQNTDAIICYGVSLEDPDAVTRFDEDEDTEASNPLGWIAYRGVVDGIELVRHCHCEAPMYVVAIAGTRTRAWRGSPKAIDNLDVPGGSVAADAKLKAFCEKHKLPFAQPRWWLASDWC